MLTNTPVDICCLDICSSLLVVSRVNFDSVRRCSFSHRFLQENVLYHVYCSLLKPIFLSLKIFPGRSLWKSLIYNTVLDNSKNFPILQMFFSSYFTNTEQFWDLFEQQNLRLSFNITACCLFEFRMSANLRRIWKWKKSPTHTSSQHNLKKDHMSKDLSFGYLLRVYVIHCQIQGPFQ